MKSIFAFSFVLKLFAGITERALSLGTTMDPEEVERLDKGDSSPSLLCDCLSLASLTC